MNPNTSPAYAPRVEPAAPAKASFRHSKRSYLKLPVPVDVDALLRDYHSIPKDAWATTHWGAHYSSNMLLLRGGQKGTSEDFTTKDVVDQPCLAGLPYIRSLIAPEGPFGEVTYAFIFRMRPMGIARPHTDDDPSWQVPFRVHVPITTNDGALLMTLKKAIHFNVGEVWTFDNQSKHAVVNGDQVRTHLIFDVQPNPTLAALLDRSEFQPGVENANAWRRAELDNASRSFAYAHSEPISLAEKQQLGLKPDGFAARVLSRHLFAKVTRAPIEVGDVIYSVNGVEVCEVARTALDYVHLRHRAGELLQLGVIRHGKRRTERIRLYKNVVPESLRRGIRRLSEALG
jgi:hypothetical protein